MKIRTLILKRTVICAYTFCLFKIFIKSFLLCLIWILL